MGAKTAIVALLFAMMAAACGSPTVDRSSASSYEEPAHPGQIPAGSRIVIAVLGDSLTAGLGLLTEEAFPNRLQDMFWDEGYQEVEIVNAGVSGDTTAGGLRRVEGLLAPNVRILVVALGGNDALRGLSVAQTRQNLTAIVDHALASGVDVLLTGMEGPTNLGEDYRSSFRGVFTQLAADHRGRVTFVPFLLEGVAGHADLNQADGIHPNARGAELIAQQLYPLLRDMVDQLPVAP